MSFSRWACSLGVFGILAFVSLSSCGMAHADDRTQAARLAIDICPAPGADNAAASSRIEVQGKDRSADELQLLAKRELEDHPDLAVVFRIDGRSAFEVFYAALSACYNAGVPAVTFEMVETIGSGVGQGAAGKRGDKPDTVLPFRMPPKPGTDGRTAGFRPEVVVRLYREGDRTVVYALGHEKLEPGAALKLVLVEGIKAAGDAVLVLRVEREVPCRDVMAAYAVCREAGAGLVVFAKTG